MYSNQGRSVSPSKTPDGLRSCFKTDCAIEQAAVHLNTQLNLVKIKKLHAS